MSHQANVTWAENKQEVKEGAYDCNFCGDMKVAPVKIDNEYVTKPCPECALEDSKEIY